MRTRDNIKSMQQKIKALNSKIEEKKKQLSNAIETIQEYDCIFDSVVKYRHECAKTEDEINLHTFYQQNAKMFLEGR